MFVFNLQLFGGRGQGSYKIKNRIKGYNSPIIENDKLNYILAKDKFKARYFNALGYTTATTNRLKKDISKKLKTNKALKYENDEFGNEVYQVNMQLGIKSKSVVTTAWVIPKGKSQPEFVSAYKNQKYNKGNGGENL